MIFRTINDKITKSAYEIEIKNIDLASGHWGSEKTIVNFLDGIEGFLYNKETFNKNIILHTLNFLNHNLRIKESKFFTIPEENKLILFVVSSLGKLKEFEPFSKEMTISFKKDKFVFSIVEILEKDFKLIKEEKLKYPDNWKLEEYMTDRANKLKDYV